MGWVTFFVCVCMGGIDSYEYVVLFVPVIILSCSIFFMKSPPPHPSCYTT